MTTSQPSTLEAQGRSPIGAAAPAQRRGLLRNPHLWAALSALALAMIFARVALLNLTSGVVGGDIDGYENMWNNYWVKTALFDLQRNPFFTDYLYYPSGISLRYHTLNPFNSLLTLPFNLTLGYIPTTNLLFVVALTLTTLFAFLLIRDIVGSSPAAFAGAALFTYANYNVVNFFVAGQTNMISAQWLPLYLFFMFRALHGPPAGTESRGRKETLTYIALSIITLMIMSLTDWQYVMFAVFTTLLYFGFILLTRRAARAKLDIFGRLASIGGTYAAIVALPLLLPMIEEGLREPWLNVSYQSESHSMDLLTLLGPGLGNPGYIALAVALVGLVTAWKLGGKPRESALFWGVTALLFYLMSFGPFLIVGGHTTEIPMPYGFLQNLPIFNIGRDPGRFNIVATLGVAVLAAFGVSQLLSANRSRSGSTSSRGLSTLAYNAILPAFLVLTLSPFFWESGKAKVDPPEWPDFYRQIAQDEETYAILELPPFTERGRGENHYQMYQVLHGKPRFGGRWARDHKLTNPNNFVKRAALVRHFWLLDYPQEARDFYYPERDFIERTDYLSQGLAILNYYNVRYIVVYEEAISPRWDEEGFQSLLRQVLGKDASPVYSDPILRAYRVPNSLSPPPYRSLTLETGDGWHLSKTNEIGITYRWADNSQGQPSELYAMNLSTQPVRAILEGVIYAYKQPRTVRVAINGYEAYTIEVRPEDGFNALSLELTVPPGNNVLTLTTDEPPLPTDNPQDARLLSFGMYSVTLEPK